MIPSSANAPGTRIFLGLVAGALSVLLCHQTTYQIAYWLGVATHPAFRMAVVPPFNVPVVVSLTFWGAMFGVIVGLTPRLPGGLLLRGLLAGVLSLLMAWFVVRPMAGHAVAFGWKTHMMIPSALANLAWGYGVVLLQRLLSPRCLLQRSRAWAQHNLAT